MVQNLYKKNLCICCNLLVHRHSRTRHSVTLPQIILLSKIPIHQKEIKIIQGYIFCKILWSWGGGHWGKKYGKTEENYISNWGKVLENTFFGLLIPIIFFIIRRGENKSQKKGGE